MTGSMSHPEKVHKFLYNLLALWSDQLNCTDKEYCPGLGSVVKSMLIRPGQFSTLLNRCV